jgi:hypothetical protein
MSANLVALLDFDRSLQDALRERDGERALALVDEQLQGLQDHAGLDQKRENIVEILARNIALGRQVLELIRSDLADVQRQRLCVEPGSLVPARSSCSYKA